MQELLAYAKNERAGVSSVQPKSDRQFYTVAEAARVLDVSQATIWRWIEAQRLPAYRVGPRRLRIRKQDIERVVTPVIKNVVTVAEKKESNSIFAHYDVQRVQEALRESAGALASIDREELLADIHAARSQDSHGRPA